MTKFVFVLGRGKLKAWCPGASPWRVHRARGGGRWTKGSGPVWSDQLEVGVCAGSGEDGGRVRIKGVLGKGNNTRVGEGLRWWRCRAVVLTAVADGRVWDTRSVVVVVVVVVVVTNILDRNRACDRGGTNARSS